MNNKPTRTKYVPRNDNVLIEMRDVGRSDGGIALPDQSIEGKEFIVRAIGPKVEKLCVGDKVLMIGKLGDNYYPLPGNTSLLVLKQENVVLVITEG